MSCRFDYQEMAGWPSLAWAVRLEPRSAKLRVFHGGGVELREEWFGEIVWAGSFDEGGFDRTDVVAGSGGRLRDDHAAFVATGASVDRLCFLRRGRQIWLSNSLCCLLAATGARIDPSYPHYFRDVRSIGDGLDRYRRTLESSAGPVELCYFDNLLWDGRRLQRRPKPDGDREIASFDHYRDFLLTAMEGIASNLSDAGRRRSLEMLGALSSGYDSTAVTAIARRFGCREALTVPRSRDGGDDSGVPIAPYLDVRPLVVSPRAWRDAKLAEVPFLAANACGEEVYLLGAEQHLRQRVLFTGYFGDQVWGKDTASLGPDLVWGGHGLSLTEYRLEAGFLHCPMAYWGARSMRSIHRISNAPEMASWDVAGTYSRPICRRIVEEAGVPRELFGNHKRAVAVLLQANEFLTPASLADYLAWLRRHRAQWWRRGRLPPLLSPNFDALLRQGANYLWWLVEQAGWDRLSNRLLRPVHLRRYTFPWAVEHMLGRYSDTPID